MQAIPAPHRTSKRARSGTAPPTSPKAPRLQRFSNQAEPVQQLKKGGNKKHGEKKTVEEKADKMEKKMDGKKDQKKRDGKKTGRIVKKTAKS